MIIPPKLKRGDQVRVIAPALSLSIISQQTREIAINRLSRLGLKVTFGSHTEESDEFDSSSLEHRLDDIHQAFSDKNVKGILTVIGGFNSNQLLRYLDYALIKSNPKVLCGYSDITALQNAIFKKTGLVTYSGPHFSTFGMLKGIKYTIEYFKKCLMSQPPFEIRPSDKWSDDEWYIDQENRHFNKNSGFLVINQGVAVGRSVGGNLNTFNLLQGTEFTPSLTDSILFLEEDNEVKPHHFDRKLQSLIHRPDFRGVLGIVIGRFQKASQMTNELLTKIIKTKRELNDIPVIAGVDFGHTTPHITFPIGGRVKLYAKKEQVRLEILDH